MQTGVLYSAAKRYSIPKRLQDLSRLLKLDIWFGKKGDTNGKQGRF